MAEQKGHPNAGVDMVMEPMGTATTRQGVIVGVVEGGNKQTLKSKRRLWRYWVCQGNGDSVEC